MAWQAAQVMRQGEVLGRKQVWGAISPKEPGEPCSTVKLSCTEGQI